MGATACMGCKGPGTDIINSSNLQELITLLKNQVNDPSYDNDMAKCIFTRKSILKRVLASFLDFHNITPDTKPIPSLLGIEETLLSLVFPKSNFQPYDKQEYNYPKHIVFNIVKYPKTHSFYAGFCLVPTYSSTSMDKNGLDAIAEASISKEYPEGMGTYLTIMPDGFIKLFDGIFECGVFQEGIIIDNESIYIGGYSAEGFKGKGKLFFYDQSIQRGEFEFGLLNGKNCQIYAPDKYFFEGECFKGAQHGKGKQKYINHPNGGIEYEGDLVYGFPDGTGKMTFKNGDVYEGEWKGGNFHGKGKLMSINQTEFEGEFANGMKLGPGKLSTPNKFNTTLYDIIEGSWKDNKYSGKMRTSFYDEAGTLKIKEELLK